MRGVWIHGALLVLMLLYGYKTWTRDTSVKADLGAVVVLDKNVAQLSAVVYETESQRLKLERRGQDGGGYWWGTETRIEKKAKQPPQPPPTETPGTTPTKAKSPEPAPSPPPVEWETTETTTEFPVRDDFGEFAKQLASMRALRELPLPPEAELKDYGLDKKTGSLTLTFGNETRSFTVGGRVSAGGAGAERYVIDLERKKLLIVASELTSKWDVGTPEFRLRDPKGFDTTSLAQVTITAPGKAAATFRRGTSRDDRGNTTKVWNDARTGKPNLTAANFLSTADRLQPTSYKPELSLDTLTLVAEFVYAEEGGKKLGELKLYMTERLTTPAAAGAEAAGSVKEYYVWSPKTRVPGAVDKTAAERIEADLATVLGQ